MYCESSVPITIPKFFSIGAKLYHFIKCDIWYNIKIALPRNTLQPARKEHLSKKF